MYPLSDICTKAPSMCNLEIRHLSPDVLKLIKFENLANFAFFNWEIFCTLQKVYMWKCCFANKNNWKWWWKSAENNKALKHRWSGNISKVSDWPKKINHFQTIGMRAWKPVYISWITKGKERKKPRQYCTSENVQVLCIKLMRSFLQKLLRC